MFIPTLRNITIANFALYLYYNSQTYKLESKYKTYLYLLPEEKWEPLIKQKLPPTEYTAILRDEITAAIRPISFELGQWYKAHRHIFREEFPQRFTVICKSDGTVEQLKTADLLIQSQYLKLETRFVLACQYWNWDAILEFWNTLPAFEQDNIRQKYAEEVTNAIKPIQNVAIWLQMLGCRNHTQSCSCRSWSLSLFRGNVTIWNRTFEQIPPFYKQIILKRLFLYCVSIPIGRRCLSRMNANERAYVLQLHPYQVLRIYLFWPLQPLFIDDAPKVMDKLSNTSLLHLIHILICQKILPGWRDSNYVDLLRKFWRESHVCCKEYVMKDQIFEILTIILEGKGFRTPLGVPQRYLIHGGTVFKNAELCASISDTHKD